MMTILNICLLIQRCVLSKQNIDYYSSLLMALIGIKVLLRQGCSEMAVWRAGRVFASATCFHSCPVGFKLSVVSGYATWCHDCLVDFNSSLLCKG